MYGSCNGAVPANFSRGICERFLPPAFVWMHWCMYVYIVPVKISCMHAWVCVYVWPIKFSYSWCVSFKLCACMHETSLLIDLHINALSDTYTNSNHILANRYIYMCVCVCVCVCGSAAALGQLFAYPYTYIHTHTHTYICMHAYIPVQPHTSQSQRSGLGQLFAYPYTYIHACMHTCQTRY